MIPSVLSAQLRQGIEDFLKTTFPVSTPFFHGIMDRLLLQDEGVFKSPFLTIQLPFRMGEQKTDLLPDIRNRKPPYLHQELAFQRLSNLNPRSTIIATGTGSGKTECFLYPILQHCYRNRAERGIKAILIYPMNALATDQANRLAEMIFKNENIRGNVTAGLFIGQEEKNPHKIMTPDAIISDRETLRRNPPDILLTNYKMLDYLLIRAKDYPIWNQNTPDTLRYLVVDELHTFDGAQGTDLACLLRRLKVRLSTPNGHLCCVGTSATLGEQAQEERLTTYASEIFGEGFEPDAIISEFRISAGEFLEKSLISQVDIVPPEKADLLHPEQYSDYSEYIRAQHALWFDVTIPPEEVRDSSWRIELAERLKGHLFFQNLIKVLGGRVRSCRDILSDMERVTPEFRSAPFAYKILILSSILALVSSTKEKQDHELRPFLNVRYHLWLRELRRMVGKVSPSPELCFADDLNDEQLKRHMPLVHCRECGSMGWSGIKRKHDSAVYTDLQNFYVGFFRNDPKVIFIFPEDGNLASMPVEGQFFRLCSDCIHLTEMVSAKEAECPKCGGEEMIRVFVPNSRTRRDEKPFGNHNCPYCGAYNGLTILGSRAASLTSVAIAQLYASTFNDDKKVLAFSDAVQDAAHRAGFFTGRTYRFNLRSAIQQYVQKQGDGQALDQIPAGFIRHWLSEMKQSEFIATFIAPDMTWLADYETLKESGTIPAQSSLLTDVQQRIEWEIHSEYGFRCRIGRTLEKTGSSVAHPDAGLMDQLLWATLEPLRNEISGLRNLDEMTLARFLHGFTAHLKGGGGILHPALEGYIQGFGNSFTINRIHWMPGFGFNTRAPAFLTTRRSNRFDMLFSTAANRATWYEAWADKCFAPVYPLIRELISTIYEIVLKGMTETGLLAEKRIKGDRIWGIRPNCLRISPDVVQFRCGKCGHDISGAGAEREIWQDAPCLRFHCDGQYAEMPLAEDYYRKLYTAGDIERIFAEEHTGLLDRETRQKLEECFKKEDRDPWDPNLLSCTPTLEMGIDIGKLSSVILCSVPPTQANYLQRIGRAGRRDGNALNLTVANARPHDLFFFAGPEEMIAGQLEPPGVFLNASAVLERQFTAFCLDRWVETGISEEAIPRFLRQVLGNLEKIDPQKFPHNFLGFVDTRRTELYQSFIRIFSPSLSEDSVQHIQNFVEGGSETEGSLSYRILQGLFSHFRERDSLKKKVKTLSAQIRKKKESRTRDGHYEQELDELNREKNGLQSLITRINNRQTLQFLADEGLIPNYAFPEAGVVLRSIIYRRKKKVREGESGYDTITFDYERPAVSAISELAPENNFYAGGRKVRVDQVDLAVSEIETWRFCNNCDFHGIAGHVPETGTCPECGSILWSDAGQKRQMIRMRQVFATTSDRESRISDESDDRDPSFYNRQMMIRYSESDIADAYRIDTDDLPFGLEFLNRVHLREINFGEKSDAGENLTIAGLEAARKGFIICRYCGKVQTHRREIQHTLWCGSRKKSAETNLTDCVYLYREFSSEAIQILLPVTTFEGSDRKLHSFIAALHLGLKRTFRGNIDHLQTAVHEEPVPDSAFRKKKLVLYDTVPGGTGYLKQLMRTEQPLLGVFEAALDVLKLCPCSQDPGKDGCYKCLFAYRRSYNMAGTSRETAKEMLSEILAYKDRMVRTRSLKDVNLNVLFDSELEARFIEALRRVRIGDAPARLTREVVNGKPGYFYKIGGRTYYIELQASLGPADGVALPSRADFMFRPARMQEGMKPIAIFTDGFFHHRDRVGQDMAQRCAIARSGRYHVWSLTWKDIENQYRQQGGYFHNYLDSNAGPRMANYNRLLETYGVEKLVRLNSADSFEWLTLFLADPDVRRWQYHAFVHGLIHLDAGRFASDEGKGEWRQRLLEDFPEEIAERAGEVAPPCYYGLYETGADDDFFRLYVAVEQEALQEGRTAEIRMAGWLRDHPDAREHPAFEAAWNGFLRAYNLFQFLGLADFATLEGKASGHSYERTAGEEGGPAGPSASDGWAEIRELTHPRAHALLERLAQSDWPLPEVGFELAGPGGEIQGEAELAWPDLKIALLEPEHLPFRDIFESARWQVFEMDAVLENQELSLDIREKGERN